MIVKHNAINELSNPMNRFTRSEIMDAAIIFAKAPKQMQMMFALLILLMQMMS
jgi:hypothetical protein